MFPAADPSWLCCHRASLQTWLPGGVQVHVAGGAADAHGNGAYNCGILAFPGSAQRMLVLPVRCAAIGGERCAQSEADGWQRRQRPAPRGAATGRLTPCVRVRLGCADIAAAVSASGRNGCERCQLGARRADPEPVLIVPLSLFSPLPSVLCGWSPVCVSHLVVAGWLVVTSWSSTACVFMYVPVPGRG